MPPSPADNPEALALEPRLRLMRDGLIDNLGLLISSAGQIFDINLKNRHSGELAIIRNLVNPDKERLNVSSWEFQKCPSTR